MPRLFSVGNVVVDLLAELPALPASGDDVTATSSGISAGGSFNTLVAAQRQGLASVYAGAHGDGPLGGFVRGSLSREGIEVLQPPTPGLDTGWDVAVIEPGGERTFITTVGAEAALDSAALDRIAFEDGDVLHVSGYSFAREPSAAALASWVPSVPQGVTVIVDPGPLGGAISAAVRARADWWSAARGEALGDPHRGSITRKGREGCILLDASRDSSEEHLPGFTVNAVDTNGAGDTHVGVFAAGLALGLDPRAAAVRANAGAAYAVMRRGPATAPTADELDAFIATHPPT
jgi:sugar/nucleoside kinase (ribokinase family)